MRLKTTDLQRIPQKRTMGTFEPPNLHTELFYREIWDIKTAINACWLSLRAFMVV